MVLDDSMVNLIAMVVIGLISLGVGTGIGFVLAGMRQPSGEKDSPNRKGLDEAARMWRDQRTGRVSVELAGQMYHNRKDLSVRQRAALAQVYAELQTWLGVDDLPGRIQPPAASPAPPAPVVPPTLRTSSSEIPPTVRSTPPAPPSRPPSRPPVQPPSTDISDILSGAMTRGEAAKEPVPVARSIAAQIDDIVQARLPNSSIRGRAIKLRELPDGSIVVMIDGQRFSGIGEVTDPAVRTFLQECVAEWERRSGGD